MKTPFPIWKNWNYLQYDKRRWVAKRLFWDGLYSFCASVPTN